MKPPLAALAALALSAAPFAHAADTNPAAVQAGSYKVEPTHTRVLFSVNHMGFNAYFGEFTQVSGTLVLDAQDPTRSRLEVSLPVAGLDMTNATLESELRGPQWLDAAQFPTIRFVSTRVVRTGPDTARIEGDLTLHGVTRPATLDAHFNGAGINPLDKAYTVGFSGEAHVHRSEFGVKTYVPLVGDDLTVTISAAFEKQP